MVRVRFVLWLGLLACLATGLASAGAAGARVLAAPLAVLPGQFAINVSAGTGGTISPAGDAVGDVGVDPGLSQDFAIAANTGYHIQDVLVDGVSVGAVGAYTFTNVSANHTIVASFAIDTFTITVTAGAGGSITPGTGPVDYGTSPIYTITPAASYHIASLTVDGTPQTATNSWTFTNVTAVHSIEATFALDTYTITVTAGAGGGITPGTGPVDYGTSPTYAITPAAGYHIDSLTVDGTPQTVQSSWTFTNVTANHTIAAGFAVDTFTITATAGAHGSISPAGASSVDFGGDLTFSILPDVSYRVADVLVDGLSQGPLASYTFTNVTGVHIISASFTSGVATRLSLDPGPRTVTFGRTTTIAATLLRNGDTPIGGGSVALWAASSPGGAWTQVGDAVITSTLPGSEGTCSVQVTPLQRTFYSLRYTPTQGNDDAAALSEIVVVQVRPLLGSPARPVAVKAGKLFTVSGALAPHFAKGAATVQVRAYRLRSGHWRLAKRVATTIADSGDASRYSVRLKLTIRGTYRFRAEFAATAGWAGATSRYSGTMSVR